MTEANPFKAPEAAVAAEPSDKRPPLGTGRAGLFWGTLFGSYFVARASYLLARASLRGRPLHGLAGTTLISLAGYFFVCFLLAGWMFDRGRLAKPFIRLLPASLAVCLFMQATSFIGMAMAVRQHVHADLIPLWTVIVDIVSNPMIGWTALLHWGLLILMGLLIRWRTA